MVRLFTLTLDGVEQKFAALDFDQVEHFSEKAGELAAERVEAEKSGQKVPVKKYTAHMIEIVLASLEVAEPDGKWNAAKVKKLDKGMIESLYQNILVKSRMIPGEGESVGEVAAVKTSPSSAA